MRTTERNDAGVVAVSGLAMAVFLTAVLYYEIGVGDAIAFKEQLQDASDAAGFSAAVYHARGMNMIVLLNLMMAAVLAIIVILRVLEMLFGIVAALVPAICWIPGMEWLCPLEGIADAGEEWAQSANEVMDPIVHTALKGLNDVATVVAVGMPWVALIKSGTVGVQYYPQVTSQKGGGTIMLSMSMMPDVTWIPAVSNAADSAKGSITSGLGLEGEKGTNIDGKRWGLPVQEGEFNVLCSQAAQVLPDLIEWAINSAVHGNPNANPPKWLTWLNSTIGGLIGSFPQYFCDEGAMTAGADTATEDIQKAAQTQCDANEKQWTQCKNELTGNTLPTPPNTGGSLGSFPPGMLSGGATNTGASGSGGATNDPCDGGMAAQVLGALKNDKNASFDKKACMKTQTTKLNDAASKAKSTMASALPKAIYPWAANGNDYMAIWSFGWGNFKDQEESGVGVAEWSKSVAAAKPKHTTMLAKAEFFYAVENPCDTPGQEQGTKGSSTLCGTALNRPFWGDYAADTMWNPRWKARLRRVSPPMIPIGQMASSGLQSLLGTALHKAFGMIPGIGGEGHPSGPGIMPGTGSNPGNGAADGAGADWVIEFITSFIQIGGGEADSAIAGQIEKAAGYEH